MTVTKSKPSDQPLMLNRNVATLKIFDARGHAWAASSIRLPGSIAGAIDQARAHPAPARATMLLRIALDELRSDGRAI